MVRTTLAAVAMFIGIGIVAAPVAAADADDLTNVDVAASAESADTFTPYKVTVPEPASGGQGPFDHFDEFGRVVFDDGLSDSSRAMLERIRATDPPAPVADVAAE